MTNPEQSVIDSIDALINEQLDAGEPIGGYDYNDPDYPKCGRCGHHWHGLPEHGCLGINEGPDTPPCPHCGRSWHRAPVGFCEGSTFIGPRVPTWSEREPAAGISPGGGWVGGFARGGRIHTAPLGTPLPTDDVFDPSAWIDIGFVAPYRSRWVELLYRNLLELSTIRAEITALGGTWDESWSTLEARRQRDQLIRGITTDMHVNEAISFAAQFRGRPYTYRSGHEVRYSFIDEIGRIDVWPNPLLPASPFESNPLQRHLDPRPWRWVPRKRVIPAYTIEPGAIVKIWDGDFNCTGEMRQLRITGTRPELVDATLPTLEPIPRWATDPERLRWALTHPTIADGRPYMHGRDFQIGVGTRVGWDNGDGNVWIGTVTEEPRRHAVGWQITLGGRVRVNRRVDEPGYAVAQLADEWHHRTREQPPMWTVNPGRRPRRNTRRRHR